MNTLNINAETNANIIGDDSSPTLTLENSSSGNALLVQTPSGSGVPLAAKSGATEAPAASFEHSVLSSATVAVMRLTQSAASGAFFEFKGFLASTASMGSITRGIRCKFGDAYGFIPIYMSGTYI